MPRWRACLLVALLGGGAAFAQCEAGGGRTRLEVDGIGIATFAGFETDRASGSVVLFGDVCVEDLTQAWRLRAARVHLTGLRSAPADPKMTAEAATVTFQDWSLTAAAAFASTEAVTLSGVRIAGPDVIGTADAVRYAIAPGIAHLTRIELQGTVFRATAGAGVLEGGTLVLTDTVATTCTCDLRDAPYTVAAPRAEVGIATGGFVLQDAVLHTLGLEVPLPDRVALTGELADDIRLPLMVQEQAVSRGDLGQGLTVLVPELYDQDGVTAGVGVTSVFAGPRPVASLDAEAPGVEVVFALPADGFVLDSEVRRDLGRGFGASMAFHNRQTPRHHHLHQGVLRTTYEADVPLPEGAGALEAAGYAFAAASAQRIGDAPVAGARLGAGARAAWASPATPVGRFRVRAALGATGYPDQVAHQLALSVAPSWSAAFGPVELGLAHELRLVDGASPFARSLDRLDPVSQTTATARVATEVDGAELAVTAQAHYDFLPDGTAGAGFTRLGAALASASQVGSGELALAGALEVAGLVSERAEEDPYAEAGGAYTWSGHQLGARVRYDLAGGALADVELSGRVRMVGEDLTFTPYLAVDLAPVLAGAGPELTGHGVEIEWRSCCGTLVLGYEQYAGEVITTLSFRVDPRPLFVETLEAETSDVETPDVDTTEPYTADPDTADTATP